MLTQNGVRLRGVVTHAVFRNQGPGGETQKVIINESGGLDIKATGSLVDDIHRIDRLICHDASGEVYAGTNISSGAKVEIWLASSNFTSKLETETRFYKALTGSPGFPFIRSVDVGDRRAMVHDAVGPSLPSLQRPLSLDMVLILWDQFILRVKAIHEKSSERGKIVPDRFRMGLDIRMNQVIVAPVCTPSRNNKKFASIRTHLGCDPSRDDDLWSLLYIALFLLDILPWQSEENEDRILEMKLNTVKLYLALPPPFQTYLDYVQSLDPDEKPDYHHLRKVFRDAFRCKGLVWDHRFAWVPEVESQKQLHIKLCKRFQEAEGIFRPNLRWHLDYLSIIHDNLLVLQGVPASQSLRRAQLHFHKKAWGRIHCFLEALRAKLAVSRECMLSFTCFAYSTMILFLEEFSGFENTLHEYLGNISRYISAISTGTDIEHWENVAHDWFLKAYGRYPTAGEPNFSLGITSPNAVRQLFYYSKALYAEAPCAHSLQPSFNTFFDVILVSNIPLLRAHASLFASKEEDFGLFRKEFLDRVRNTQIRKVASRIAIINITAMLGYGNTMPEDEEKVVLGDQSPSKQTFENARLLNNSTLEILLQKDTDADSVLSFIYINLVFMYCMSRHPGTIHHLECKFPWKLSSNLLNSLPTEDVNPECVGVPRLHDCPPEDKVMQGIFWAKDFLQNAEQFGKSRNERILSIARKLAELGHGFSYSSEFSALSDTKKDTHELCSTIDSGKDEALSTILSEEEEYVLVDRDDLV